MSIGIRQPGRDGNAPISPLPGHEGGSEHPHSIAPLVTLGGKPAVGLRQTTAICNKTGGKSARAEDYQSGCGSPACKIAR
jgi:hypothetical protein